MYPQNGVSTHERIDGKIDEVVSSFKQMSARASLWGAKVSKAIKDHPYAALGIAFGCGYLFTKLLRK